MTMFHRSRKRQIERHGFKFDNPEELRRYEVLLLRFKAGEITQPEVHPEFPVTINGVYCWSYFADFRYHLIEDDLTDSGSGRRVLGPEIVEDLKPGYWKKKKQMRRGVVVREWKERAAWIEEPYRIKKAVVEAQYEIKITEIWK